jgi:two-component system phosphate regulon response regulator PhoB
MQDKDILIVDDEADTREAVSLALELEGFEVRCAATAAEALRLIDERHPAVMIVDMLLPFISGLELCRLLRRRWETAGIPIIVYSGHPNPDHTDKGLYELALAKSVATQALVLAVETLLTRLDDQTPGAAQRRTAAESSAT